MKNLKKMLVLFEIDLKTLTIIKADLKILTSKRAGQPNASQPQIPNGSLNAGKGWLARIGGNGVIKLAEKDGTVNWVIEDDGEKYDPKNPPVKVELINTNTKQVFYFDRKSVDSGCSGTTRNPLEVRVSPDNTTAVMFFGTYMHGGVLGVGFTDANFAVFEIETGKLLYRHSITPLTGPVIREKTVYVVENYRDKAYLMQYTKKDVNKLIEIPMSAFLDKKLYCTHSVTPDGKYFVLLTEGHAVTLIPISESVKPEDIKIIPITRDYTAADYAEAVKLSRNAAEHGDADAQNNLGWAYREGKGVPQNYAESVEWFRTAAEQGNADAQNNLGWAYREGKGVPQDYAEAIKWFRKAAEQGNAAAQNNLGCAYDKGRA